MKRRAFITLVGTTVAVLPFSARAQEPTKRPVIAVLNLNSALSASPRVRGFVQALHELGYLEGRDFDLAERYADGQLERLSALADELFRLSPALFVTGSVPAALAVRGVSKTVPIVGVGLVNPVSLGLAESEARPGGQVTGTLISIEGLPGKQIAMGTEAIRGAAHVGLLTNPRNQGHPVQREGAQIAAAALALKLVVAEAASPKEIDLAFESLVRANSDLVLVLADPVFNRENKRIAVLAAANRLPTMFAFREYVEAGGLMSYGFSLGTNWRRGAYYVDRILHGTKPGDLPMELPTKLELVINLSTARAIGLTIPESFLLRADEVIE